MTEELDFDWGGDGSDLHEPVQTHAEAAVAQTDDLYPAPVDRLLEIESSFEPSSPTTTIAGLGLTQEHVPDLVRMARDRSLHMILEDSAAAWAPIHALIALQQFDIEPVAGELVPLFDVDSEVFNDQLIDLLALGGPNTLEVLGTYVNDRTRWIYGRTRAASALQKIASNHPDLRERAIALLSAAMERPTENDLEVNGFLLAELLALDAVEALPVIREAFEQDAVDETIAGDWGDTLEELGQPIDPDDELVERSHKSYEQRHAAMFGGFSSHQAPLPPRAAPLAPKKAKPDKSKAKRKMSKASRKANKGKKKR
ncbi:MAG TPA: hypothetical protein VFX76_19760 [Roseiflexaceae bacterium]|nr:hypothetical protein [Roseiflexaceae bacterium]